MSDNVPNKPVLNYANARSDDRAKSLKRAVISGTAWTLFGYGAAQALRLGSNLIMTRLLFPEAFGVMSLVYVVMSGLQMFSDVGIQPALVQHKRGEDPVFVNTAWTIQVIRGFLLWISACVMAWPAAMWFEEPYLIKLIPVASLTAVIGGFNSTSLALLNRKLALGKMTLWDLVSQGTMIITMVAWARWWPSVWALVAGGLIGSIVKLVLSHTALPGIPCRWSLDREAMKQLMRFGRWVFIGTAFTFFSASGDRLVLGRWMTKEDLGIYSVAQNWSIISLTMLTAVGGRVFFPLYSEIARGGVDQMRSKFKKARMALLAISIPIPCIMAIFGSFLIQTIYDSRYHEAGYMLEVLSVGVMFQALNITISPIMLATGDSFSNMVSVIIKTAILIGSMVAGGLMYQSNGLIWGIAISNMIYYVPLVLLIRKTNTWFPAMDAAFVGTGILVIGIIKTIMNFW